MPSLKTPTLVEKLAGNLGTETSLTLIGVLSGSPVAALLPVLSNTFANERNKKRVENAFVSIDAVLRRHEVALQTLTDSQYKLINETVLAVLHTTSDDKLTYLRRVIGNAITLNNIAPDEAVILSRIVRDISVGEAEFVIKNFGYSHVRLATKLNNNDPNFLEVLIDSPEGKLVPGLVSLGILANAGGTYADLEAMRFMPITAKLIALLKDEH